MARFEGGPKEAPEGPRIEPNRGAVWSPKSDPEIEPETGLILDPIWPLPGLRFCDFY